jgi:hypothetical protein
MQKEIVNAHRRSTNIEQAVMIAVTQLPVVIMEKMRRMVRNSLQREGR